MGDLFIKGLALLGLIIGGIALVLFFAFVGAYFTMLVVNYLFASSILVLLFGVAKFSFWKAFTLNFFLGSFRAVSKK